MGKRAIDWKHFRREFKLELRAIYEHLIMAPTLKDSFSLEVSQNAGRESQSEGRWAPAECRSVICLFLVIFDLF